MPNPIILLTLLPLVYQGCKPSSLTQTDNIDSGTKTKNFNGVPYVPLINTSNTRYEGSSFKMVLIKMIHHDDVIQDYVDWTVNQAAAMQKAGLKPVVIFELGGFNETKPLIQNALNNSNFLKTPHIRLPDYEKIQNKHNELQLNSAKNYQDWKSYSKITNYFLNKLKPLQVQLHNENAPIDAQVLYEHYLNLYTEKSLQLLTNKNENQAFEEYEEIERYATLSVIKRDVSILKKAESLAKLGFAPLVLIGSDHFYNSFEGADRVEILSAEKNKPKLSPIDYGNAVVEPIEAIIESLSLNPPLSKHQKLGAVFLLSEKVTKQHIVVLRKMLADANINNLTTLTKENNSKLVSIFKKWLVTHVDPNNESGITQFLNN